MKTLSKKEIAQELIILENSKKDPRHFGLLYEKYYKQVFLFIYRRTSNYDTTGDLCSQVFLKALNNLEKYQYRGLPFIAWLIRVASNEVNMHFRSSNKNRSISLEDGGIHRLSQELDETNDKYEQHDTMIECLQELNEDEIVLLELRYFENNSIKETAYILNESESNIKVKTHRIVKKLKLIVQEKTSNE